MLLQKSQHSFLIFSDDPNAPFLTEEKFMNIMQECKDTQCWSLLIRTIGSIFNNPASLVKSFLKTPNTDPSTRPSLKEELRSMETDQDKDTNDAEPQADETEAHATEASTSNDDSADDVTLDVDGLRRAYKEMFSVDDAPFQSALINALIYLSRDLDMRLKYHKPFEDNANFLNVLLIIIEIPNLFNSEYIDSATPAFCKVMGQLPLSAEVKLARLWSTFPVEWLKDKLHGLQQMITVKCLTTEWSRDYLVNEDEAVAGATAIIKLIYCASILAGESDPPEILEQEAAQQEDMEAHLVELYQRSQQGHSKDHSAPRHDELMTELNIKPLDCRTPLIDWEDFVNEPLCDVLEMDKDYANYKMGRTETFTFMKHPFILTTAAKSLGLSYDNRIRMLEERRASFLQSFMGGAPLMMPYLKLSIRRDHVIDDALVSVCSLRPVELQEN